MWSSRTAPDPRWAFESVDVLLDRQRLRKDAHALVRLQRAAAICDTMFGEVAQALRTPGLTGLWRAPDRIVLADDAKKTWLPFAWETAS